MAFEYKMLVLMTLFYLFAWFPASVAKSNTFGLGWVMSNRDPVVGKQVPLWGSRADRAYNNLRDFFPGFIVAVILLGVTNHFDYLTAIAAAIYVAVRILYFILYTAGNVPLRSLTWMIAVSANAFLLIKVLL